MNIIRFLRKCITDPPAAIISSKLVGRGIYGKVFWWLYPNSPLLYRLPSGGKLSLLPGHSFTFCFWPGIDQYEPDVRAALMHFLKRGDTFLDCGANIGYFSVLAAALVGSSGRVIAIEANPITYQLLQRNLALNGTGTAVHCALTNSPGELELFVPREGGDVYSSLRKGGLVNGESVDSYKIIGRTLDDVVTSLNLGCVNLVKIDIEGAELDVLRSASYLMREIRPVIICEYGSNTWPSFNANASALLALLEECEYEVGLFDIKTNTIKPVSESTWHSHYANLVLIPRERFSCDVTFSL